MAKNTKDILTSKRKKNGFTHITRRFEKGGSDEIERGIVTNSSDKLVQLVTVFDFKLVETVIFPIDHIRKFRYDKNDQYYNKILKKEEICKSIDKSINPNLKSWKSVFKTIDPEGLIVETENSKYRKFHIGAIVDVNKTGIEFLYFDAQGIVENSTYLIKYKNITRVTLDSNYSKVFQRYVRE